MKTTLRTEITVKEICEGFAHTNQFLSTSKRYDLLNRMVNDLRQKTNQQTIACKAGQKVNL